MAQTDYLEIALPDDHGGYFISNPTCLVDNASVKQCRYISSKVIRISFNYRVTSPDIRGGITSFSNPPSTRGMNNVKISVV